MGKTAIIIVHFKGEDDTTACITSFYRNIHKNEIPIIVSNCASPQFEKKLKKDFPKIEIIHNNDNIGVAKGNNLGIIHGIKRGCSTFIFLNNDTIVEPNLFKNAVSYIEENSNIGILSPKIYFAKGYEYHKDKYRSHELGKIIWYAGGLIDWENIYAHHKGVDEVDIGQYDKIIETDFATGCCMIIKKDVIEKIGILDEKYFLYYEDVDYSVRARRKGIKVVFYPYHHLWHKNASSSGSPGSALHRYYQTRNRLYFGFRYASMRTKKSLIVESINQFIHGGIERKANLDFYFRHMEKGNI
jgi:GT2 family glycosyltransferase